MQHRNCSYNAMQRYCNLNTLALQLQSQRVIESKIQTLKTRTNKQKTYHSLKIIFVFPISITLGFGFDRLPPRESPVLSLEDLWDGLSSRLDWILQDLLCLRLALAEGESEDVAQGKWLVLCSKVDRVLFRVYLFILVLYTSTLVLLWLSWGLA